MGDAAVMRHGFFVSYQNWVAVGWVGTSLQPTVMVGFAIALPTLPLNFDKIHFFLK